MLAMRASLKMTSTKDGNVSLKMSMIRSKVSRMSSTMILYRYTAATSRILSSLPVIIPLILLERSSLVFGANCTCCSSLHASSQGNRLMSDGISGASPAKAEQGPSVTLPCFSCPAHDSSHFVLTFSSSPSIKRLIAAALSSSV